MKRGMEMDTIRKADRNDLQGLDEFFELVLRDTFNKEGIGHLRSLLAEEIRNKQEQVRSVLTHAEERDLFLVALEEGAIVGTIAYVPCNAIICSLSNGRLENMGEVGTVFVRPDRQKQGIGRALRTAMDKELLKRGIHTYVLDTGYPGAQVYWHQQLGDPVIIAIDFWGEGKDHKVWQVVIDSE